MSHSANRCGLESHKDRAMKTFFNEKEIYVVCCLARFPAKTLDMDVAQFKKSP